VRSTHVGEIPPADVNGGIDGGGEDESEMEEDSDDRTILAVIIVGSIMGCGAIFAIIVAVCDVKCKGVRRIFDG
jgi:hypothetical protein